MMITKTTGTEQNNCLNRNFRLVIDSESICTVAPWTRCESVPKLTNPTGYGANALVKVEAAGHGEFFGRILSVW